MSRSLTPLYLWEGIFRDIILPVLTFIVGILLSITAGHFARSEFQPHYDGIDRWLQRIYVMRDLRRAAQDLP